MILLILLFFQKIVLVILDPAPFNTNCIINLCPCHAKLFQSCPTLVTLWTVVYQVSLSMRFSRQEHWSVLPCPSPGDLPDPGFEPGSLMSLVLAGRFFSASAAQSGWPKNTGVGSISLLQQTFPIQESNQGLLHCRRILCQLSYQRSSISCSVMSNSVTPWTVASQAPLSMDFFRQEYWSELPY